MKLSCFELLTIKYIWLDKTTLTDLPGNWPELTSQFEQRAFTTDLAFNLGPSTELAMQDLAAPTQSSNSPYSSHTDWGLEFEPHAHWLKRQTGIQLHANTSQSASPWKKPQIDASECMVPKIHV